VNFAFALISSSFKVVEMTSGDSKLWSDTTELKKGYPGLQVFLSIGGWTFNDPPTQSRFSDVASSAANRATFAASCLDVMQTYGFDGIDIDWEYPVADDRGGKPEDRANYVSLMKLLHTTFKENNYGLSFTAPSSFWYLQNFDLPGMMENVDWVNLMSYDLHGTWDRNDTWIGPIVAAHTNLTEIDEALKLFWRAGVKASQITLGLGFYGRSFTLDTASCNSPGCIWKSGGNAGPCSDNVGTLMWSEIQTILNGRGANVVFDADAAVEMLTYGDDQWVSYDDEKTFQIKINYANERCLGGTMIWSPVQNCAWVGTPPLCRDNFCQENQIAVIGDKRGDGDTTCSGGKKRAYCCDAAGDSYSPVTWKDLFDTTDLTGEIDSLDGDAMTFDAEFDQDQDSGAGQYDSDDDDVGAGTTSDMPDDEDENDEAFGEVFIDSPNPNAVSSLDISAKWVITSCDARSDQPQVALAYCSSPSDPACSHVFIGGAENTIVQMPKSCGLGPYARVASLAPHANQSILYAHGDHQQRKRAGEPVYELRFDYDFLSIPDDNGPVYMRADVTDMPDYWDTVVDSPPERHIRRQKRGLSVGKPSLQKRWWGVFTKWLDKLNTVDSDNSVSRNFHWRDKWNIFHAETACPGPPAYEASLDVTLKGKAKFDSRYGFYLQATIVPPTVKAAYLYVKADASASATLTVEGMAKVSYDSSIVTFAQFGFPGLYYPGLLTIGPSLEINGYISGELSVQGKLDTSISYTMPSLNYALGKTSNDIGTTIQPSGKSQGFNMAAGYNVDMGGDIAIHVVPQVQFGVQILGGKLINAEAFVRADLFAGLAINGSVSHAIAPKFCWDLYYGVDVQGGITGTLVYWDTGPHVWDFFNERYSFYQTCFQSVDQPTTIHGRDEHLWRASAGEMLDFDDDFPPSPSIGGAWLEEVDNAKKNIILPRTLSKRAGSTVPPLAGDCDCAAINVRSAISSDDHMVSYPASRTRSTRRVKVHSVIPQTKVWVFRPAVCKSVYVSQPVFDTWDEFNRRSFDNESKFFNSTDAGMRRWQSLCQQLRSLSLG
ncbi:glycosyl hydrolases family 18-domain-containing protein, partial [Mycena polygramma]